MQKQTKTSSTRKSSAEKAAGRATAEPAANEKSNAEKFYAEPYAPSYAGKSSAVVRYRQVDPWAVCGPYFSVCMI